MIWLTLRKCVFIPVLVMGLGIPMATAAPKAEPPTAVLSFGGVQATIPVPQLSSVPRLDGDINRELAWRTIPIVPFNAANPNIDFFKIAWLPSSNELYVGFYSTSVPPNSINRVVLGIVTHAQCHWRFHFYPPAGSGPPPAGSPPKCWRNPNNGWNTGSPIATPAWVTNGTRFLIAGTMWWSMEFKIPIITNYGNSGVWFPGAGNSFSLYLNVMNTENPGSPGTIQKPWPASAPMSGMWEQNTPLIANWGSATQQ